uniref:PNPLA domain-containing protein n=1 Tax=Oryza nivara TaxID=4536 RepID=A0A0E0HKV4_ORYNI
MALREKAGDNDARVMDFFDAAAGAGAGGVLAAMLFLKGGVGGRAFVAASLGKGGWHGGGGWRRWVAERSSLRRVIGAATLRDTVAPLLVPCYDLATAAPFPLLPRWSRSSSPVPTPSKGQLRLQRTTTVVVVDPLPSHREGTSVQSSNIHRPRQSNGSHAHPLNLANETCPSEPMEAQQLAAHALAKSDEAVSSPAAAVHTAAATAIMIKITMNNWVKTTSMLNRCTTVYRSGGGGRRRVPPRPAMVPLRQTLQDTNDYNTRKKHPNQSARATAYASTD